MRDSATDMEYAPVLAPHPSSDAPSEAGGRTADPSRFAQRKRFGGNLARECQRLASSDVHHPSESLCAPIR